MASLAAGQRCNWEVTPEGWGPVEDSDPQMNSTTEFNALTAVVARQMHGSSGNFGQGPAVASFSSAGVLESCSIAAVETC